MSNAALEIMKELLVAFALPWSGLSMMGITCKYHRFLRGKHRPESSSCSSIRLKIYISRGMEVTLNLWQPSKLIKNAPVDAACMKQ